MLAFDREIMARTAMGEARGEGELAMKAVMWTGMNRYTSKRWYSGMSLAGTFLKKMQYDCWNPSDPNYTYLINITPNLQLLSQALDWAEEVFSSVVDDPTQGATHYHDSSIAPPDWTQGAVKTVSIGRLTFYKNVA